MAKRQATERCAKWGMTEQPGRSPGPLVTGRAHPTARANREIVHAAPRGAAATWLLLVVILGTALRDQLGDPDLWWHLKTGAIIAATGQVPHTDLFAIPPEGNRGPPTSGWRR